jgi:hypothetical protein
MNNLSLLHILKDLLGFVDSHVRFAETKNAAVLVFSAGGLYAIAQVAAASLNSSFILPYWVKLYLSSLVFFFGLSILFALFSFYPKKNLAAKPWRQSSIHHNRNLMYYNDIQDYNSLDYLKELHSAIGIPFSERSLSSLEIMYSEQIIVNSRIACRKFMWFKASLCSVLVGIFPPFLFVFIYRLAARTF